MTKLTGGLAALALTVSLAACGGPNEAANNVAEPDTNMMSETMAPMENMAEPADNSASATANSAQSGKAETAPTQTQAKPEAKPTPAAKPAPAPTKPKPAESAADPHAGHDMGTMDMNKM